MTGLTEYLAWFESDEFFYALLALGAGLLVGSLLLMAWDWITGP